MVKLVKKKQDQEEVVEERNAQDVGADDDQERSEDVPLPGQVDEYGNLKGLVVPPGQEMQDSNLTPHKSKAINKEGKKKKSNVDRQNAVLFKMMFPQPQNYEIYSAINGDSLNPKKDQLKKAMKKARDGYQLYDSFRQFQLSTTYGPISKKIQDIVNVQKKKPQENSSLLQRLAAAQKYAQKLQSQKRAAQKALSQKALSEKLANQKLLQQKIAAQKLIATNKKLAADKAQKQKLLQRQKAAAQRLAQADRIIAALQKKRKLEEEQAQKQRVLEQQQAQKQKILDEQQERLAAEKKEAQKKEAEKKEAEKKEAEKKKEDEKKEAEKKEAEKKKEDEKKEAEKKKEAEMDIQPDLQEQLLFQFENIQVVQQLLNGFRNPNSSQLMYKRWSWFKNAQNGNKKQTFFNFFVKMYVAPIQLKLKESKSQAQSNPPQPKPQSKSIPSKTNPPQSNPPQSNPPQSNNKPQNPPPTPPKTQLAYCSECAKGQVNMINGVMTKLSRTINKKAVDVGPTPMCGTCINLMRIEKAIKKNLLTKQQGDELQQYIKTLKKMQMDIRVKQALIQWIPSSKIKQHSQKGYLWKITIPLGDNLGNQQWASSNTGSLGQINILSSKFKRFYLPFHFDQYVGYYSKESLQNGSQPIAQRLKKYLSSMKANKRGLLVYYLSICIWTALSGSKNPRWGKDAAQIKSYDTYLKIQSSPVDAPEQGQSSQQIDF